jgi:hypothetical protein
MRNVGKFRTRPRNTAGNGERGHGNVRDDLEGKGIP